jgi:hypothetical protein
MNTKEIKITIPEGYEIDKENSTFECIKFKKKGLTYEDVAEKLFTDRITYFIGDGAKIDTYAPDKDAAHLANNATSGKQLKRLLAINKLMNVAEYLNDGWKPNWKDTNQHKWTIKWDADNRTFATPSWLTSQTGAVCFKTSDLALQAIEILGEEEVKLALGV